jgi:hypothetical protein
MGMLEHLLRSLNSDIVNTIFLFSMLIIFALGIGLARKGTQVDFVNYVPTLLRKVRTSIPRTINENFSHLISMGYQ